ncbi:MAG: cupin domain-containing protein, partial [Parachlamydiaceae bacterium]
MTQSTVSKLFFSLRNLTPKSKNEGGILKEATLKEVPGFVNISFANLQLKPKGFLKPMWHPNTDKIGYCTQGKCLVKVRSPEKNEIFSVEEGEIFFIT